MNPLTLHDLAGNAFRILGLTADASQAHIDAAARKMRIWQDPLMIPESANDAPWIGPVPRTALDIENAVARLADPLNRMEERFWWFCKTPPETDTPPAASRSDIPAYHDASLVHLYRSLLGDISGQNLKAWHAVVAKFRFLAESDDYLQWLLQIESNGDFEKVATLEEIANAQNNIPQRLSTALAGSVQQALEEGDFITAKKAVQLAGAGSAASGSDELLDRMEDDLTSRCKQLTEKIDDAWKTRKINLLRPACNHVVNRFEAVIQPAIGQLVSSTRDVDRHNRARMLGVELLLHTARAYQAFENYLASERTLETAHQLAHDTPMAPMVVNLLEKARQSAGRQRQGVPFGRRSEEQPQFKVKPGGKVQEESWLSAIPPRLIWWVIIVAGVIGRAACSFNGNSSGSSASTPSGSHVSP